MKTKNKEELREIAKGIFTRYPKAQKVACTSDGMAFIVDEGEHAVKNHARKNRYGKELSIHTFLRDEVVDGKAAKPKNSGSETGEKSAKDLIAEIEAAKDAEAVNVILEAENKGKKRTTVIEAAEAKLASLKGGE